jgi:hypothetical protein
MEEPSPSLQNKGVLHKELRSESKMVMINRFTSIFGFHCVEKNVTKDDSRFVFHIWFTAKN